MLKVLFVCGKNRLRSPTAEDEYDYMQPALIELLRAKVVPHLPR